MPANGTTRITTPEPDKSLVLYRLSSLAVNAGEALMGVATPVET